jgi:hypothetical protein
MRTKLLLAGVAALLLTGAAHADSASNFTQKLIEVHYSRPAAVIAAASSLRMRPSRPRDSRTRKKSARRQVPAEPVCRCRVTAMSGAKHSI